MTEDAGGNTNSGDPEDPQETTSELAEIGTDLAGALVGGGIGLIGGPIGAFGGAVAGVAVQRAAAAAVDRLRGRERERAGAALVLIAKDSEERKARGERIRDDGFFSPRDGFRADAEELLEGILRLAASTYEERKVPLLSNLFSAVAHDESVSAPDAQFLVRVADDLTYRQFVCLAVIARTEEHNDALINAHVARTEGTALPDPTVLLELNDLADRRLVGLLVKGKVVAAGETYGTENPLATASYGQLRLTATGAALVRLTRVVEQVSQEEINNWIGSLTQPIHRSAGSQ